MTDHICVNSVATDATAVLILRSIVCIVTLRFLRLEYKLVFKFSHCVRHNLRSMYFYLLLLGSLDSGHAQPFSHCDQLMIYCDHH